VKNSNSSNAVPYRQVGYNILAMVSTGRPPQLNPQNSERSFDGCNAMVLAQRQNNEDGRWAP